MDAIDVKVRIITRTIPELSKQRECRIIIRQTARSNDKKKEKLWWYRHYYHWLNWNQRTQMKREQHQHTQKDGANNNTNTLSVETKSLEVLWPMRNANRRKIKLYLLKKIVWFHYSGHVPRFSIFSGALNTVEHFNQREDNSISQSTHRYYLNLLFDEYVRFSSGFCDLVSTLSNGY